MLDALPFRHVIPVDFEFEFGGQDGEQPRSVCMVAKDLRTGQEWRLSRGEFGSLPPFPIGPDSLFVAYYASAELGCFKALGWPMPLNVLDLFVEFRNRTNGLTTPAGSGLVGALTYFGLDNIGTIEKDDMRSLVLRGGPWSQGESDVRRRRSSTGAAITGNAAADRSAAGTAARTLHESGRRHGMERRAYRHRHAGAVAQELDPHSGPAHC